MKLAIVLAVFVSVCAVSAVPVQRVAHPRLLSVPSELEARTLFESFKRTHGRTYHPDEEPVRFTIFKESLARAASRNQRDPTATFGVTQFSDLTVKEFKQRYLNKRPTRANPAVGVWPAGPSAANVTKVDWREKGAVTPVKNQGQCGSCWAFSTVEEIESMLFLEKGPPLHDFSTQQVVDCDNVDQGCNGGDTTTGYKYVMKAGGLEPNQDYPYQSGNSGSAGQCQADPTKFVPIPLEGFRYAVPGCYGPCKKDNKERAEELANKLAGVGPISICVYAEPWQDYTGGVLSTNCDKNYNDLDHCVQLVGYDRSGAQPYWMIRNSWAASWGIDGYIHVEMGKNLCGVQDEATIAEIKH